MLWPKGATGAVCPPMFAGFQHPHGGRSYSGFALSLLLLVLLGAPSTANDIYVMGYNDYGQLGLGDYLERATQTLITDKIPLDVTNDISAGLYHNVIAGDVGGHQGLLYTWGRNTKGQLGIGSVKSQLTPVAVKWETCPEPNSWVCSPNLCKSVCDPAKCINFGPTNPYWSEADMHCVKPQSKLWVGDHPHIIQVETGEDSSFALTEDGTVYSWGSNDWGQLGISDFEEERLERPDGKYLRDVPQLVGVMQGVRVLQLSAGAFHVVALSDIGNVWVWGQNAEGQLGLGDLSQRNQPEIVTYLLEISVTKIACGAYHTMILTDFGELYTTGLNANGQLGHGDEISRKTPALVHSLRSNNISAIAAGDYASYAISDTGEVYSWGNNAFRQLGHGNESNNRLLPERIEMFEEIRANIFRMFGGQRTVFAVDEASDVYAIGNNDFGMLGLGDETQRPTPAKINAFLGENVYKVASGAYHSVAITGCWEQALPCSGHGSCNELGKCDCDTGFRGYRCADECPGGVGNACSLNGDCVVPQDRPPYCLCYDGYGGEDCSRECPGGAANPCTLNGICLDSGDCECNSGWSGIDCSIRCPGSKSSPCSNLGACTDGKCNCYLGFAGENCSTECNGGAYNPCTYNGICQSDGSCECFVGYRYDDCSCECPGGHDNICHGRGECLESCQCACRMGYRGKNCSTDCPGGIASFLNGENVLLHVCTGHGECDAIATCHCDVGWSGVACENGPFDWTLVILTTLGGLIVLCGLFSAYAAYHRRKKKLSERERKRNARKKLRAQKKKRQGDKRDKSKKKGKVNR